MIQIKRSVFRKLRCLNAILLPVVVILFAACSNDEPAPEAQPTGDQVQFSLGAVSASGVTGLATFAKLDDASIRITVALSGTTAGGDHPMHIHANTAAEGGGIVLSLTNVEGGSGSSETVVTMLDDGTAVTYEDFLSFDGYINVHSSEDDLGTLLAQGDIGQNELTGETEDFELFPVSDPTISGEATISKRSNGETLLVIELEGENAASDRPAHIHANTAAEGGGIVISLSNVVGGISKSNISALDDGSVITYDTMKDFDGYVNVHASESDLGTLVAQGDFGINELTGDSEEYALLSVSDPGISGTAEFFERKSEETLVVIELEGDEVNSDRPAHIHMNTAAEGGGIVISLSNVEGGSSQTNVSAKDDGSSISYDELIDFDGYINVHSSATNLGTLVAQGDVGQNELTGEAEDYSLSSVSNPSISGIALFKERVNGETLIEITLEGDATDSDHPAHIHGNTAAEGGGIAIDLTNVEDGKSKSNVNALNDGTPITFNELLEFDGYINVHNSPSDLGTLVAQGDIGQNALTGMSVTYSLVGIADLTVSGIATFSERKNGETLVVVALEGTSMGGDHPSHIHDNDAATGGGIAIDLANVNGDTGIGKTNVTALNDDTPITYDEMINFDGYINVHMSSSDLGTLVAQGNIGSNG